MLYTHHNAAGATVHDVDTRERLSRVMEIDTKNGWVKVGYSPHRISPDGKGVLTRRIRFRSIYPIFAGQGVPVMFHCYGRRDAD
ncbi:MAG: hypothetical protein LBE51_13740 [Acidovorax sp.]|jgi:hypothetical protein|nr:hypothetical protein [Acidovorax sp.]